MPLNIARSVSAGLVVSLATFSVVLPASAASLIPVSQHRSLTADSIISPNGGQDIDVATAPDFGPFDAQVSSKISGANAAAVTTASQISTVDACSVIASGTAFAHGQSTIAGAHGYSIGVSTCRVVFDLDQQAECLIAGTIHAAQVSQSQSQSQSQIYLQQFPSTLLFARTVLDGSLGVHHRVMLDPGRYMITFQSFSTVASNNGEDFTTASNFDLRFTLCFNPADVNVDGTVNANDLLMVINGWGACPVDPAPCAADITLDGQINVNDLLAVINAWGR